MTDHTQAREALAEALKTQEIEPSYMRPNIIQMHIDDTKRIAALVASLDAEIAELRMSEDALARCREACHQIMGSNMTFVDDDVARTLVAMKAEREWRTMESAPKDGTPILARFDQKSAWPAQTIVWWNDQRQTAYGWQNSYDQLHESSLIGWMPLPEAPEGA